MGVKAIVLAAGQGTRMKSDLPKVLHPVAGRPMVEWVLEAVGATAPDRSLVVVGYGADQVAASLPEGVETCLQATQLGTGHAAQMALDHLEELDPDDTVVVVYGDTPLITGELLSGLVEAREGGEAALALITTELDHPTGYGRILRDRDSRVTAIVEEREASPQERAIREVNPGMYAFRAEDLVKGLAGLSDRNARGEHYLTDALAALVAAGRPVLAHPAPAELVGGVNSHEELAAADRLMRRRIAARWMEEGVWIQDPDRVYLDARVRLAPGVRLYPGVHLEGSSRVGGGSVIGPEVFMVDSSVGELVRVWYSVLRQAEVGDGAQVGPYASLRPGTVLGSGAKAGTFVEMKNTTVGEGAKVPHLSYMGDAEIGPGANVGAGSITCNYDGYEKQLTRIGPGAFIGSGTMLVAPVSIGEGAVTGAGSVITEDVEDGALAIERSSETHVPGYAARREARHRARQAEDAIPEEE